MSVVALRQITNNLIERKHNLAALVEQACQVRVHLDERLIKICGYQGEWDDNIQEQCIPNEVEDAIGTDVPALGEVFIQVLTGSGDDGVNIDWRMEKIARLAVEDTVRDTNEQEPDMAGWSSLEIEWIQGMFENRINKINNEIRDIYLTLEKMFEEKVYVNEKGDLFNSKFSGRVPFLEAGFLTKRIGKNKSEQILGILNQIMDISTPLPGEPAVIDNYSGKDQNIRLTLPLIKDATLPNCTLIR